MWCELVSDFSRLEQLSGSWLRWVDQSPQASIFQNWGWARASWRTYGAGTALCAMVVHDKTGPAGILPLVRRARHLEFLGSLESDYNDLIYRPDSAPQVLEAALEFLLRSPDWTSGLLDHLPEHSALLRSIPLLPQSLRRHLKIVFRCYAPTIEASDNRAAVLDRLLHKDQLRRYHNKLRKLGTVTFRHYETRSEARRHLNSFFRQHVARCAMNGVRSQFVRPDRRAFYGALIDELDPAMHLRFGALELNSRPVAYHFGFQVGKTLLWYKPAFDVNYWEHCPGDVLLHELIHYVREHELNELDFTIGDEPFKRRFANRIRRNYAVYLERHPWRAGSQARSLVRATQEAVRTRPELKARLTSMGRMCAQFVTRVGDLHNVARSVRTLAGAAGQAVWSSEEVRFHVGRGEDSIRTSSAAIARGTLADLANLSVEYGDLLSAAELHECRRRLKRGDLLMLARTLDGKQCVIWLRVQDRIQMEGNSALALPAPALVIDHCWTAPRPAERIVPAEVFSSLRGQLGGREAWIHSTRGREDALDQALTSAGFAVRYRLVRRRLIGTKQDRWITPAAEEIHQPESPAVELALHDGR
jgi:CelD/BcsL family acetyltransferase involved in cellulose biosynthesis